MWKSSSELVRQQLLKNATSYLWWYKDWVAFKKKFPSSKDSQLSSQSGEFPLFDSLRFRQETAPVARVDPWNVNLDTAVHPGLPEGPGRITVWTVGPIQLSLWLWLALGLLCYGRQGQSHARNKKSVSSKVLHKTEGPCLTLREILYDNIW